jgi:EmrB/QacA subfamily drug resistance transporter
LDKQHRLVLVASILASFVAFLDMTVVNVALPAIRDELGGGLAAQQWIVDAYLLTLGSLMPAAGSISDLFGRNRVLVVGLVGFGAASLLCALAPSLAFLVVARGLQGAAGALLVPSSLALVIANFTGSAQTRAIATWTAWSGISTIAGPLLGGALVDTASWRWVFAINVLPIAVTLGVVAALERERTPKRKHRVDLVGASLCVLGLGGVTFGLIELPLRGFSNPAILLSLVGGTLALVGFVAYERKARDPMVDLELFRRRNFAVGNAATLAIYAGLGGVGFLVSVFLQQVAGYSATAAGLALMPVTAMLFFLSPVAGRLAEKYGPRWFMAAGPVTAAVGVALMTRIGADGRYVSELLPGVLLFGAGLSVTVAPLTAAVLGDVDERQAGVGSAVNNAVARLASLLSIAAVGALAAAQFGASVDERASQLRANPEARAFLESAKSRPFDASVPPRLSSEVPGVRRVLARASVASLHAGLWATTALLVAGGMIAAIGITNRQRRR